MLFSCEPFLVVCLTQDYIVGLFFQPVGTEFFTHREGASPPYAFPPENFQDTLLTWFIKSPGVSECYPKTLHLK